MIIHILFALFTLPIHLHAQMNDASTSDIGDTVIRGPLVPTSGQWCTQCGMHCINEGECYTFPEYARIKKEKDVNWLEVSRVCKSPILPAYGDFTIQAMETELCDEPSNISHYPRSNCIDPTKPVAIYGQQPNCWITEEPVIIKKGTVLKLKGIKNPDGRRPILSGNRKVQLFYGEDTSELILNHLELHSGFVQGTSLHVSKDSPISGFQKKHGAHLATNGYVKIIDCIFSGGFSAERYASAIFHHTGASGFMFRQSWRPPRGIPVAKNALTTAASVLLEPASRFEIRQNSFYEGLTCDKVDYFCKSDPSVNCCSNMIAIENVDKDQGFPAVGELCCAKIMQVDELPMGHCCRELLECGSGDNQKPCVCNQFTVCASKNNDGNGVCCALDDLDSNGDCCARECLEWTDGSGSTHTTSPVPLTGTCTKAGKPLWDPVKNVCTEPVVEGARCQVDEECSVCTEATGLTCEKSSEKYTDCPDSLQCNEAWMKSCKSPTEKCVSNRPGKCMKTVSVDGDGNQKESKKVNELLFGQERFEYNAPTKSYEFEWKKENQIIQTMRI